MLKLIHTSSLTAETSSSRNPTTSSSWHSNTGTISFSLFRYLSLRRTGHKADCRTAIAERAQKLE